MPCPYSLIIFDCDGVLVDTGSAEAEVVSRLLLEQSSIYTVEHVQSFFQGRTNEAIWQAFADDGVVVTDALKRRHLDECYAAYAKAAVVLPGVHSLLAELVAAGIPICVASNGPHEQMAITLGVTSLLNHFEGVIFSAYDVPKPKPAPDLFLHAAAKMGFEPRQCAVIEDSPSGVHAGLNAGMAVYQLVHPDHEPVRHRRVTAFSAMPELSGLLGLH